ncbi:hypothetical protein GYK49_14975, partial [Lactobacillus paracasei]|uniref:hypothetical protein n=1 Tax=Lacticaseibacillus paracasei TaxID=1597 RepID=UPI0013A6A570
IKAIQKHARETGDTKMQHCPVIIFRSPKGRTGPKSWNGEPIEGSFRAHQIPIPVDAENMEHADSLAGWLKAYHPEG